MNLDMPPLYRSQQREKDPRQSTTVQSKKKKKKDFSVKQKSAGGPRESVAENC